MQRELGIAVLILGAALLLIGATTRSWWTSSDGKRRIGLAGMEVCTDAGPCELVTPVELSEQLGQPPTANNWLIVISGKLAFYGAFAFLALAVAASLLVFARPANAALVGWLAAGVVALLLVLAIAFVIASGDAGGMSVGSSLYLYMLGTPVGALGATILAQRRSRPPKIVSTPGVAVPACPRCKAPTEWVEDHRRHLCRGCSIYV